MNILAYNRAADYERVRTFLSDTYTPGYRSGNWQASRWEYMHYHPNLDSSRLHQCGLWEENGRVVGVVNYEDRLGDAYFHVAPGYENLRPAMLDFAEANLAGVDQQGKRFLRAWVNDFDPEFQAAVESRGYSRTDSADWLSEYHIPEVFPAMALPDGFRLQTLAEENDLYKVNRCLYRGFNHPGEPPDDGLAGRRLMQSAPNFRHDLTVVVVAPGGDYVAFAGLWYDPVHRACDVEPVATDPDYRRLGLGKAAVLDGIRRCALLGATVAYVGSGQAFYEAMGFRKVYARYPWVRRFAG